MAKVATPLSFPCRFYHSTLSHSPFVASWGLLVRLPGIPAGGRARRESGPRYDLAYREQTVEIVLGPKGAFEKGNIGTLTRRVPADWVVSAVPPSRGDPKPLREPMTPQVVELLRKAIEWQTLLESGKIANQADIARKEGITRARVTQVMGMLRLAPEIQQNILSMPEMIRRSPISERMLRPIATIIDRRDQLREFQGLLV